VRKGEAAKTKNNQQIDKVSGRNKWRNIRTFRRRKNGHNRYKQPDTRRSHIYDTTIE
jgi:hypothetical protein